MARLLAKSVNCENLQGAEPCNRCQSCLAISEGSSVDVIEIDAASNRGIDEIRALRESVRYLPSSSKFKVYIIDEVHMLTQEAFNALLKTIEEPPERVIFILATTAPHKVPLTITSRCQCLEFKRLSIPDIQGHLKKILSEEGVTWDENSLSIMARNAQGSMRDALSILDLCVTYGDGKLREEDVRAILGETPLATMIKLFRAIAQRDLKGVLEITTQVSEQGKDMGEFSLEIATFTRDLLLIRSGQSLSSLGRPKDELEDMMLLSRGFSLTELITLLEIASRAVNDIKQSDSPRLVLETALLGFLLGRAQESAPAADESRSTVTKVEVAPGVPADTSSPEPPAPIRTSPESNAENADLTEMVKSAWPKLLEVLLKKRKLKARAYLLPATLLRVEGKNLVLGYGKGYATHMEQIMVQANKDAVENELEKIIGKRLNLTVEVFELGQSGRDGGDGDLHPLVKAAIDLVDGKLEEEDGK